MSVKEVKILLLGDERVGKSSLYDRVINNKFPNSYTQTKEIQFKKSSTSFTGETINLQFWDLPGNDQHHKKYISIYLNTNGIIVMFDITNKNSFENIFKKWIPNFFNFLKIKPEVNFPIAIFGNFSDLANKRFLKKPDIEVRLKKEITFTNNFYYE